MVLAVMIAAQVPLPFFRARLGQLIRVLLLVSALGVVVLPIASCSRTSSASIHSAATPASRFTCPEGVRCFYIAWDGGSDTNTGLNEHHPWKTAPGMQGGGSHHGYLHRAGDEFIFKGGVTWPVSVFPFVPVGSGDATHDDVYTVDPAWYSGPKFNRAIFDADNSVIGGSAATSDYMLNFTNVDYITLNGIELTGFRADATVNDYGGIYGRCAVIQGGASDHGFGEHLTLDNLYIHDMYVDRQVALGGASPSKAVECYVVNAYTGTPWAGSSIIENSTIAGDGDTYMSGVRCFGNIENDVIYGLPNLIFPCGHGQVSGNKLYDCAFPHSPTDGGVGTGEHNNAIETLGSDGAFYIHDNLIYNITAIGAHDNGCETMLIGNAGETDYVYNNVAWNLNSNAFGVTQNTNQPGIAYYAWNNSLSGGFGGIADCFRESQPGSLRKIDIRNNLCISSAADPNGIDPALETDAATVAISHNLDQARTTGYFTSPFMFAQTAAARGTGHGADLTAKCRATIGLCSDTTYAGARNGHPRPDGSPWDIGAFQGIGDRGP
jgi:hypothetical protein